MVSQPANILGYQPIYQPDDLMANLF